jgi:hypothetical protein
VEQAAETVAALDGPGWRGDQVGGAIGRAQAEPLVWSGLVVVANELGEDLFQVTPPKISRWSSSSRRAVPTQRSANEFARGDR